MRPLTINGYFWAGSGKAAFGSTIAQSGTSANDPIAAISPKCSDNLQACF